MMTTNISTKNSDTGMPNADRVEYAAVSANMPNPSSATAAISSGATSRDSSPDLVGELGFERDQTVNFVQHGLQSCEQGLQAFGYVLELLKQLPPGVNITPDFIARAQQAEVYCQQLLIANTEIQRLQQDELVLASALESQAEVVKMRNAQITALEAQNADLIKKLDATDRISQGRLQQFKVEKDTNTRLSDAIKKVEGDVEFFKQELKTVQEELEDEKSDVQLERDRNSMLKDKNKQLNEKIERLHCDKKKDRKCRAFFNEIVKIERDAREHRKRRAARKGRSPLSTT